MTQAISQSSTPTPSSSKARLEELVIRQSKQLIPVVASTSSRDKAKGKGTAASGPKHGALAAPGAGSGTGTGMGRSKTGIDGAKRGEELPSGTQLVTHAQHLLLIMPSRVSRPACGSGIGHYTHCLTGCR